MAVKMWHPRAPFERMTSWFDHDFIADNFETEMNPVFDCEEKDGTYVIKADQKDH